MIEKVSQGAVLENLKRLIDICDTEIDIQIKLEKDALEALEKDASDDKLREIAELCDDRRVLVEKLKKSLENLTAEISSQEIDMETVQGKVLLNDMLMKEMRKINEIMLKQSRDYGIETAPQAKENVGFNNFRMLMEVQLRIFSAKYQIADFSPGYDVIKKEEIKFLIFSGGGAKGGAYAGADRVLHDNNLLEHVEAVAGSSAGAMNASFIAMGLDIETIEDLSENLKVEDIKTGLQAYLEKGFCDGLRKYISDCRESGAFAQDKLPPELWVKIAEIERKITVNEPLTLGDLATLRQFDPKRFKHLHITATNMQTGKTDFFTSENPKHYDIPISLACLASAALPRLREAVIINGVTYNDGGVFDNVPFEAFKDRPGRKLAFVFASPSNMQALTTNLEYSNKPGLAERALTSSASMGLPRSGERHQAGMEINYYNLKKYAFGVIALETGEIGTISFKNSIKLREYLTLKGEIPTQEYVNNYISDIEQVDHTLKFRSLILRAYELSGDLNGADYSFCQKEKWVRAYSKHHEGSEATVVAEIMLECFAKQKKLPDYLTDALNEPECSPAVKKVFMQWLEIPTAGLPIPERIRRIKQDGLSAEQIADQVESAKIADFRFRSEDFESVVAPGRESQTFVSRMSRTATRSPSPKDKARESQSPSSHTDQSPSPKEKDKENINPNIRRDSGIAISPTSFKPRKVKDRLPKTTPYPTSSGDLER